MDKKDIDRRAAEFARALEGPLGLMPLEKVLRQHVALFTDLRLAGASWRQIAALMVHHGVQRKDGQPLDATQWAAMVSRAGRALSATPMEAGPPRQQMNVTTAATLSDRDSDAYLDRSSVRARMRAATAIRSEDS